MKWHEDVVGVSYVFVCGGCMCWQRQGCHGGMEVVGSHWSFLVVVRGSQLLLAMLIFFARVKMPKNCFQ
jgi:hypothetical protein